MPKSRLEESDKPKAYSNRAMPSNEPCNLGQHDHTDSPAYKTPDAVNHRDAPVDDSPGGLWASPENIWLRGSR